ncbi:MAG: sigma-70 family RNA polymerase sigma factor [Eubacterium sp.]|nr:sigma-70 family RNA polymerase sigma factor [Eubacterium sp.]
MISGALSVIESAEDREALNQLYLANADRFYSVAYSKVHNSEDAEDAVQEAFLRISDCPDNLFCIPENKRVSYIDVVIRNVAIEMFHKRNAEAVAELDEDMADLSLTPEEYVLGMASRDEIVAFIRSMPEGKKDAMLLKMYHHMSNTQIAEALGISETAARKRISDAYIMINNFVKEGNKL